MTPEPSSSPTSIGFDGVVHAIDPPRWLTWLPPWLGSLTAVRVTIVTEQLRTALDSHAGDLIVVAAFVSPADSQPLAMAVIKVQTADSAVVLHAGCLGAPAADVQTGLIKALALELEQRCRDRGIDFLQWPRCPDVDDDGAWPRAMGFERAGRLQFMALDGVATLSGQAAAGRGANDPGAVGRLKLVPADPVDPALVTLIEKTYFGSLDCPGLSRHRTASQIVDGYRTSDGFQPRWWFRIIAAGEDRGAGQIHGVLILGQHVAAPSADGDRRPVAEVVYMGLVPSARGRGRGRELIGIAHRVAAKGDADRVILAVDRDNFPAIAIYRSCGYNVVFREDVWIKTVSRNSQPVPREVVKIMTAQQWRTFNRDRTWDGSPDDRHDGFIHLSTAEQTAETLAKHFAGQTDLVLVRVSTDRLGGALRWEPSRGGALFPHLYAPMTLAMVTGSEPAGEIGVPNRSRHVAQRGPPSGSSAGLR